ncbi:MAG: hypothetical protein FWH52_01640 [Synergistaceae bacterium]|nr:hypothetical protein [Synergistaceae bacterium]
MNQESLYSVIAIISPGIIQHLMDDRSISEEEAAELLYNSYLYSKLEDEKTKLWHLSPLTLYDLLDEELSTGKITWPEEQT